jgi:hypothetical protein
MNAKLGTVVLPILMAACATSAGPSNAERALVFGDDTLPTCEFEPVQDINVTVSVQGDSGVAEEALHRALARDAGRRGADGVIGIRIQAPERVPVVLSEGQRPTQADLPPVRWSARAQAIRFVDPACRA